MTQMLPPSPPQALVAVKDPDGLERMHFRLWQILLTALTVLITTWFCTFGWAPAILALMTAKHILVALFVAGYEVPAP